MDKSAIFIIKNNVLQRIHIKYIQFLKLSKFTLLSQKETSLNYNILVQTVLFWRKMHSYLTTSIKANKEMLVKACHLSNSFLAIIQNK